MSISRYRFSFSFLFSFERVTDLIATSSCEAYISKVSAYIYNEELFEMRQHVSPGRQRLSTTSETALSKQAKLKCTHTRLCALYTVAKLPFPISCSIRNCPTNVSVILLLLDDEAAECRSAMLDGWYALLLPKLST
jgi:hypothetical protein